jgi:hypothetical protein
MTSQASQASRVFSFEFLVLSYIADIAGEGVAVAGDAGRPARESLRMSRFQNSEQEQASRPRRMPARAQALQNTERHCGAGGSPANPRFKKAKIVGHGRFASGSTLSSDSSN